MLAIKDHNQSLKIILCLVLYQSKLNIAFLIPPKVKQESPRPTPFYLENVFLAWVIIGLGLILSIIAFLVEVTANRAKKPSKKTVPRNY